MKQMKTTTGMLLLLWIVTVSSQCKKSSSTDSSVTPLTVEDIAMPEGTGGISNATLTLKLHHSVGNEVKVSYATVAGSAKPGDDFTAVSGQAITFQPGETEKKINIPMVADDLKEADETFQVRISNPVNATLLKETINITIRNDDSKVPFNNTGYDAPTSYPTYNLVWSDEFNGALLDPASWVAEVGDGCPGVCGWGNNELEYYLQPPNNLFFQDGKMILEARAESYGGKNYTSTRIKTQGLRTFKYGRIDIRAILPIGKGLWPALWMLPQDNVFGGWPRSGELDIMEQIGSEPAKVAGTLHYGPGPQSTYLSKTHSLAGSSFHDQFHVFSLEWKEDEIRWLVDGAVYATTTKADIGGNNWPFNEKFFFIVNLAVGGNWPGAPDASTVFPQWFILDYIRVYQ